LRAEEETEMTGKPTRRGASKQLPPRPPLPRAKLKLPAEGEMSKPEFPEPRRRRGLFSRLARFLARLAILAGVVYAVIWAASQPFAQPYTEKVVNFTRKMIDVVKGYFVQ